MNATGFGTYQKVTLNNGITGLLKLNLCEWCAGMEEILAYKVDRLFHFNKAPVCSSKIFQKNDVKHMPNIFQKEPYTTYLKTHDFLEGLMVDFVDQHERVSSGMFCYSPEACSQDKQCPFEVKSVTELVIYDYLIGNNDRLGNCFIYPGSKEPLRLDQGGSHLHSLEWKYPSAALKYPTVKRVYVRDIITTNKYNKHICLAKYTEYGKHILDLSKSKIGILLTNTLVNIPSFHQSGTQAYMWLNNQEAQKAFNDVLVSRVQKLVTFWHDRCSKPVAKPVAVAKVVAKPVSKPMTPCQPHVVFTTFKCPKCDNLRKRIEDNTLHMWSEMETVTFEVISDVQTNNHSVPILGAMYTQMFAKCPNALTYTYVNGDIIASKDFVDTIEAVLPIGDFLMVGKRVNVPWNTTEQHDAKNKNFDFDRHFKNGVLWLADAQDYFTVTKNAIDWNKIPSFVIGRPGYDNWLVDHIYHNSKVALVDATKTVYLIHQTDTDGNLAQGGKLVKSSADREYNRRIGKGQWDHGKTYHAEWETVRFDGKIVLKNRKSHNNSTNFLYKVSVLSHGLDGGGILGNSKIELKLGGVMLNQYQKRGFNFVTIHPITLGVIEEKSFDTYASAADKDSMIQWLKELHSSLTLCPGCIILGGVYDEGARKLDAAAYSQLRTSLGVTLTSLCVRCSFAFISKQGGTLFKELIGTSKLQAAYVYHIYGKPRIRPLFNK